MIYPAPMPPTAEATIDIAAPIDLTWQIMLDLGAYGAWNPFIFRVDGAPAAPRVGAELTLQVRWSDGGTTSSRERITVLDPPRPGDGRRVARLEYQFRGALHALHLVRGSRLQALEQSPGGPTRYRTFEEFRGLLKGSVPLAKVRDGFDRHARALKQRAESLAAFRG
jgi:hypothetical protein